MANQITVGEDSKVTTNIKTILWFLGICATIIIALTTYFYLSLSADIDKNAEDDLLRYQEFKTEIVKELDDISNDNETVSKDVWEIKGDIKVLLDRTAGVNTSSPNPTVNATPPSVDGLETSPE